MSSEPEGKCCDNGDFGEEHLCQKQPPDNRQETGYRVPPAEYQFKPGQSGNPGGRPKKRLIDQILTELLEENEGADATEIAKALIAMAKKDPKTAQLVAERTEGKPKQKVEHTGEDGGPIQTSIAVRFV